MKITLEYDDDSAIAQALNQLSERAVVRDGESETDADGSDIADDAVRRFVAQTYSDLPPTEQEVALADILDQ